jgi:hypothetical protein
MSEPGRISTEGNRSANIGGDVINSILITGDHTIIFAGPYECLRDAYIPPWSVFERASLESFTGRDWLTAEIEAFLRSNDRGYFVLEAKAGLGKTAFLAHLVKERGYIHHFVGLVPGQDGIGPGLKNLAAQLVRAWALDRFSVNLVLSTAAERPDFLQNLLFEAARHRDEVRPGEKIVLVVDALDEAGTLYRQNVLGLPKVLPEGVFIIVSQRPVPVALHVDTATTPRRVFHLAAGSDKNQADMRRFLEQAATWPGIAQELRETGYKPEQFITALSGKCRGVWIYLHYVIREIERRERSPLDLDTLPNGLTQYYASNWQRWHDKDRDKWNSIYLPLLTSLAAAQQAVRVELLADWIDLKTSTHKVRELLDGDWQPFLVEQEEYSCYSLYHATLVEFVEGRGEEDKDLLTTSEKALVDELCRATRQAHRRIAEYYLDRWGGLDTNLKILRSLESPDWTDKYGLRHTVYHLIQAGQVDELHRLLASEWSWVEEEQTLHQNCWYSAREQMRDTAGYQADIERAWRLAETSGLQSPINVGHQCRYALIMASLNSLSGNIPPSLLPGLVSHDIWSPEQARAYARLTPRLLQRLEALIQLAPIAEEPLRGDIFREALALVRTVGTEAIGNEEISVDLVSKLAEFGYVREALAAAQDLPGDDFKSDGRDVYREGDSPRTKALVELAPHLGVSGHCGMALEAVQAIQHVKTQTEVLGKIAPYLSEGFVRKALSDFEKNRAAEAQSVLILRLAEPELGYAEEAVRLVRSLPEESSYDYGDRRNLGDETRAKLIRYLPDTLRLVVLSEIWYRAWDAEMWRGGGGDGLARTITELAPSLEEPQLREVLTALTGLVEQQPLVELTLQLVESGYFEPARTIAKGIKNDLQRVRALMNLVSRLVELGRLDEATSIACQMPEFVLGVESPRAAALVEVVPHLADQSLVRMAFAQIQEMKFASAKGRALAGLAPKLPDELLPETLKVAQGIEWEEPRTEALVKLIPRLTGPRLQGALEAAKEIRDASLQAEVLLVLIRRWAQLGDRESALAATRLIRHSQYFADAQITLIYDQPTNALVEGLADLVPQLAEPSLQDVLGIARGIEQPVARIEALMMVATRLPEPERDEAMRQAMTATRDIEWDLGKANALAWMAPQMPEPLKGETLREALAIAQTVSGWEWERVRTLVRLASELLEPLKSETLQEALEIVQTMVNEPWWSAEVLGMLAPHLPAALMQEALAIARTIEDNLERATALGTLASRLPEPLQTQILHDALAAVQASSDEDPGKKVVALKKLAPHLTIPLLHEALEVVWPIEDVYGGRNRILDALTTRLANLDRPQEVLVAVRAIQDQQKRANILVSLAHHLPESVLPEALAVAKEIDQDEVRAEALEGLVYSLAEPVLDDPLAAARILGSDRSLGKIHDEILALIKERKAREEALRTARKETSDWSAYIRAKQDAALHPENELKSLVKRAAELPEAERDRLLREVTEKARQLPAQSLLSARQRAVMLAGLVPRLSDPERLQALRNTLLVVQKVHNPAERAEILAELMQDLSKAEQIQVIRETLAKALSWQSTSGSHQQEDTQKAGAKVLTVLAPYLPRRLLGLALELAKYVGYHEEGIQAWIALLLKLVEFGRVKGALKLAQELPEVEDTLLWAQRICPRATALVALAGHLSGSEPLLQEALDTVQGMEYVRVEALVNLFRHLPEPLQHKALVPYLRESVDSERQWVRDNEDEDIEVFVKLSPYLSGSPLGEVLISVLNCDERKQARVMVGLLPRLAELGYPEEALKILGQSAYLMDERARLLTGLVPYLTTPQLVQQSLEICRAIRDNGDQAQALSGLSLHLAQLDHPQEAISVIKLIKDVYHAEEAWFHKLSGEERIEYLYSKSYLPQRVSSELLVGLAPYLSSDEVLQHEALTMAQEIWNENDRATAFIGLAPYLSVTPLQKALAASQDFWLGHLQIQVLANLIPWLPQPLKNEALQRMLATINGLEYDWQREEAVEALAELINQAPDLLDCLLPKTLALIRKIKYGQIQGEALISLAPHLPQNLLPKARAMARWIQTEREREEVLAILNAYAEPLSLKSFKRAMQIEEIIVSTAMILPKSLADKVLAIIQMNKYSFVRVNARSGFMPRLAKLGYSGELLEILKEMPYMEDPDLKVEVLAQLTPYLSEAEFEDALEVVQSITESKDLYQFNQLRKESDQAKALIALASRLPESVLRKALSLTDRFQYEEPRVAVQAEFIPRLGKLGHAEEALEMTRALPAHTRGQGNMYPQSKALAGLAPHLTRSLLKEALAIAQEIETQTAQAVALAGLVPRLSTDMLPVVLNLVQAFAVKGELSVEPEQCVDVLSELSARLVELEDPKAWRIVLDTALALPEYDRSPITSKPLRAMALARLAPYLPVSLLDESLPLICAIRDKEYREEALKALIPKLAQLPREQLYSLLQTRLHALVIQGRGALLADIDALSPMIAMLGGAEAVYETAHAIRDVGRCWP